MFELKRGKCNWWHGTTPAWYIPTAATETAKN